MKKIILIILLSNLITIQANANDVDKIQTAFSIQNAQNVTPNEWSTELLAYQAKYISESSLKNAKQAFVEHGGNIDDIDANPNYESNFVFSNGEKIGIINISLIVKSKMGNILGYQNTTRISVIRGGDMLTVGCSRQSDIKIPVSNEICNDAIKKNLGISFAIIVNDAVPNRALNAIAAGVRAYTTSMFVVIGLSMLLSIPMFWVLRKPKGYKNSAAYKEGHLAFQNALNESSNPYAESDKKQYDLWVTGYKDALQGRQKRDKK